MQFDDESFVAGKADSASRRIPRSVSVVELTLRPADFDFDTPQALGDARFLLDLRNEPGYRSMAVDTRFIGWEEHIGWYRNAGRLRERHIWIVNSGHEKIGMVRLDKDDGQRHAAEVSIALCPQCRGRGFGAAVLERACAEALRLGYDTVHARVRQTNQRSLRAFQKAGFVVTGQDRQEAVTICRMQWHRAMPR